LRTLVGLNPWIGKRDVKFPLRSTLAVLAMIVGIVLVACAALFAFASVVAPPGGQQAILRLAGWSLAALFLALAIRLILFAGKALRYGRVLQIGLGMVVVLGIPTFGWLQHNGLLDRSKVTLSNGVLLIQGPLDFDLLSQFRHVQQSADLRDVRVRLRSPGGEIHVAMAMGREIRRLNLDVEVDGFCGSSCANYLFTAGHNKYVQSPDQVRFHGGALQPNTVETVFEMIRQGTQMTNGDDIPPDLDLVQARELCGLAADLPINRATNILAEKAYFDEIGVSSLTPVYGQYGDYSAWFMDGVHDSYFYEPEDFAQLGVTNVIITGPDKESRSRPALFRAQTSIAGIGALQAQTAEIYRKIEAAVPLHAGDIWRGLTP